MSLTLSKIYAIINMSKGKGTFDNLYAGKEPQGVDSMLYYSEITKKNYKTSDECIKAEEEALNAQVKARQEKERIAAERKTRAAEVEEARKNMVAARQKYAELLEAFTKDYHTYHLSLDGEDAKRAVPTLFDFFNIF